jgi:hypothetical protein
MPKMPKQKPGESRQDYQTPPEFLDAVEARFGLITWDVAASDTNAAVPDDRFFSLDGINAFDDDWSKRFTRTDLLWLNPTFNTIDNKWAPLVAHWTTRLPWLRLLFFTPASVSSEWFAKHVHRKAMVLPCAPRMIFVGEKDPYPKDLMLSAFGFGVAGFEPWRWAPTAAEMRAKRKAERDRLAALPAVPKAASSAASAA